MADVAHDVRQSFLGADQRSIGDLACRTGIKLGRAFLERQAVGTKQRLRAIGTDRAASDEQVEDRANRETTDKTDGNVALRVLGFFSRGRDRIEPDVSEENRCGSPEDTRAGRT